MRQGTIAFSSVLLAALAASPSVSRGQGAYTIDGDHSAFTFKISHLGLSWVYGRFNDLSGNFAIDADPAKSSFAVAIKTESIDTANPKRDAHLRNADFFDAKQFPLIAFKSTSVKAIDGGYQVTGDFTMHGVTKPIAFTLKGGKTAEFPKGVNRIGFTTELVLKRSDYGMDKMLIAIGDDVHIAISFEGTKK
jgi:polyisoprenoid-binding protein YceI